MGCEKLPAKDVRAKSIVIVGVYIRRSDNTVGDRSASIASFPLHTPKICNIADRSPTALFDRSVRAPTIGANRRTVGITDAFLCSADACL
jgi:hypothetical protein